MGRLLFFAPACIRARTWPSIKSDMAVVAKPGSPTTTTRRPVWAWIGLLGLAQLADLLTTQADMARGGVEANWVAAGLLAVGGLGLLWVVKLGLVAAMGTAALLTARYRGTEQDGLPAGLVEALVWRGIQVCVVVLAVTAVHNAMILGQLL